MVIDSLCIILRYTIDPRTDSDVQQRDSLPKVHSIDRRVAVVALLLSNRRKRLWKILGPKVNSSHRNWETKTISFTVLTQLTLVISSLILNESCFPKVSKFVECTTYSTARVCASVCKRDISLRWRGCNSALFTWHKHSLNFISATIILQQETSTDLTDQG